MTTCPSCGAAVVVGELHRRGQALFASFTEAETSSGYLMLPLHPARLAPSFIASVFGDYQLHGCLVTMTLVLPDGYHPRPLPPLPS